MENDIYKSKLDILFLIKKVIIRGFQVINI